MCHLYNHSRGVAWCILSLNFIVCNSLWANDWYWISDAGGTWNEEFGDLPSWRDPSDVPGLPGEGDNALFVLPYSFSFCLPDGNCITQPVPVQYRSEDDVQLNRVVLESDTLLMQGDLGGLIPASELHLASFAQVVGGSGMAFSPPPSFVLPEPPGIFPRGEHLHSAGTNTIETELTIGGMEGSLGRYELSGSAVLDVGVDELVGDAGDGEFLQMGGENRAARLILGNHASGYGEYNLADGSLSVAAAIVGASGGGEFDQSGGTLQASGVLIGRDTSSSGTYVFRGGGLQTGILQVGIGGNGDLTQHGATITIHQDLQLGVEAMGMGSITQHNGVLFVGDEMILAPIGRGTVNQHAMVSANHLRLGGSPLSKATYTLHEGSLFVRASTTVGYDEPIELMDSKASASFQHLGGTHQVPDLTIGSVANDFPASYDLIDGELTADRLFVRSGGRFTMSDGSLAVSDGVQVGDRFSESELPVPNAHLIIGGGHAMLGQMQVEKNGAAQMSGGRLDIREALRVVPDGPEESEGEAHFYQTGGVVDVGDILAVAHSERTGAATFTLEGNGELRAPRIFVAGSNAEFSIAGGRLQTDSLETVNFRWTGGELSAGSITSYRTFTINLPGSHTISTGIVENYGEWHFMSSMEVYALRFDNFGTIKLHDGVSVAFFGAVNLGGGLESDPAMAKFADELSVTEEGYLAGGAGDVFVAESDLLIASKRPVDWRTQDAMLVLGGTGLRTVQLPGEDRGSSPSGWNNNFAWGTIRLEAGVQVELGDGNPENMGTAQYVGFFDLVDRLQLDYTLQVIHGISGDATIYYDPKHPGNDYLQGRTYTFANGSGSLTAQIPEPSCISLLSCVVLTLLHIAKRQVHRR